MSRRTLPPDTDVCPHEHLVREGATVCCNDCAATADVSHCAGCKQQPTTWIIRPPHLVCYKCGGTVPGLALPGQSATTMEVA